MGSAKEAGALKTSHCAATPAEFRIWIISGSKSDSLHPSDSRLLFRFGGLWCEGALHGGIHPQLCCVTKRILSRLSLGQLLRLTGAGICLLFQMARRQKYDLVLLPHVTPHFGEYKLLSNQARGSDGDGSGDHLDLMDVAAACAAQRPVPVPGSRRRDPLHLRRAPATVAP
jgi:hypothetical protein